MPADNIPQLNAESTLKNALRHRRSHWPLAVLVAACIALNLGGRIVNEALGLPLYLDAAGTVLAAVLGGYLPGILVGYATNLLLGVLDSTNIYYASVNALLGLAAAFFAIKGYFQKPRKAFLCVPVFALIGGGAGSLLTWCLNGFTLNSNEALLTESLYESGMMSRFWAQMSTDLLWDLADKAVVVFLVLLILRILPEKLKNGDLFDGWQQSTPTPKVREAIRYHSLRTWSLRTKMVLTIAGATLLVSIGSTALFGVLFHGNMLTERTHLGKGVASLVAAAIDGDRVMEYIEQGESVEGYAKTKAMLESIRTSSPDIEYVYAYRIEPDGCHVVFDLDTADVAAAEPGEIIPFDESFSELIPALLAGEPIEPIVTDDTFGWLLTAYEPVYDSDGSCVCYAAVDISMNRVTVGEAALVTRVVALFFGFFLLILAAVLWITEYGILLPVNSVTYAAGSFAYDSDEARERSMEQFRALDIHTGDEIEQLYHAVQKTMDDAMNYAEEIRTQGSTINRMQKGLIMVLADLVESRDKCTGDHVRKTAAYTRLIMQHMRKLGIYADRMTDAFMEDVENSAPLHDVGKIQVSDTILNKPGKLTDEEFDLMKTHTTAGSAVIESAIAAVGDDSGYLYEAENLAHYHHERWDGRGYPDGLSGEDIPLSARIMAVADVFDALVSKRSYKEPFTVEAALDIIREGAGSQFDPEIVRAFLDGQEEAAQIARENLKSSL